MKVYSIIPARQGSKGVPGKNIKSLGGYPLIAYAICASRLAKIINRTIVSTDSEKIAEISRSYGAEVPFLRPETIARDNSIDLEFMQHAIEWFKSNENEVPHLLVHLRPTTPLREPDKITEAIKLILANNQATSLRSVHELAESPHKVFQIGNDYLLKGFFPDDPRPEYYNLPRQVFPKAYQPNGYVDIISTEFVTANSRLHGEYMLSYITTNAVEVDLPEDFDLLEFQLKKYGNPVYEYLKLNYPNED